MYAVVIAYLTTKTCTNENARLMLQLSRKCKHDSKYILEIKIKTETEFSKTRAQLYSRFPILKYI